MLRISQKNRQDILHRYHINIFESGMIIHFWIKKYFLCFCDENNYATNLISDFSVGNFLGNFNVSEVVNHDKILLQILK